MADPRWPPFKSHDVIPTSCDCHTLGEGMESIGPGRQNKHGLDGFILSALEV